MWPIRKKPTRRLGYLRDTVLSTDRRYAVPVHTVGLPTSVDLREYVPAILDQGPMSACVGYSYAAAIALSEALAGLEYEPVSPRAIYYNARSLHGSERRDEGTYLRSAAAGLEKVGAPPEAVCPSFPKLVNEHPGPRAYMEGHNRRDAVLERIVSGGEQKLNDIRAALASGQPVVIGTEVAEAFMWDGNSHRVIEKPGVAEPIIGGHAITLVGYSAEGFCFVNSWGRGYRDGGFAWLTDEYVMWSGTSEVVVLRDWNRLRERLGGRVA